LDAAQPSVERVAAPGEVQSKASTSEAAPPSAVLSPDEWTKVDAAVHRGLQWLARQQQLDGSFRTAAIGQPGVTSLCTLAFAAHGHLPGNGRYGERLERAAAYICMCQKSNGLVALLAPDERPISRNVSASIGVPAAYNHAISALTLSELYGVNAQSNNARIKSVIENALQATLEMQRWSKAPADCGGWRYVVIDHDDPDSDLSVTGWQLMFLRSARNSGFEVRKEPIDDAVQYVRRCYSQTYHTFQYAVEPGDHRSRSMAGAGILALAHAGLHNSDEARFTGNWILDQSFDRYNTFIQFGQGEPHDRYHYALFTCCYGMYQLGGEHWRKFFPPVVRTLLANQRADGSWPADSHMHDAQFGSAYTTSLVILSLGAANQLLPIFQR
jgi:hypothetical protein